MHRRNFVAAAAAAAGATGAWGCSSPGTGSGTAATASGTAAAAATPTTPMNAAAFHASRRFLPTSFGQIAYVERGSGPAALFIHGLPLNGFQWRGALDRLAPYRRCLAPDAMSLGYSEIPEGQSFAPEAQADMLAAFLDGLNIPTVDLVANDSGGAIAQIFVVRHPGRARTLLLTNCDVHDDSPPPAFVPVIRMSRAGRFVDDVLVPQLKDKSAVWGKDGLGTCCYSGPGLLTDEALDTYLTPLASSPLRKAQFHAYCVELARNPLVALEPELKKCQVPMRVVWGTGDKIFHPKGADFLDRTFPQSRGVRRIEGANLFFPEELPDVIAEEARKLWSV